jgi:hypothetical protein
MSARNKKSNVIKFPERRMIRPDLARCADLARCHQALEACEDDPNKLMFLALHALRLVYDRVGNDGSDDREQVIVNRLAISLLALAELFGIGAEMEALL